MGLIVNLDVGLLWRGSYSPVNDETKYFDEEYPLMGGQFSEDDNKLFYIPTQYGNTPSKNCFVNNAPMPSGGNPCDNMILTDGKVLLPIVYNPKMSSLKTQVLETKVDTMSGTYPFFVRNGNVVYKKLPIQGLISQDTDYLNCFGLAAAASKGRTATPSPQTAPQDSLNSIVRERRYKLKVEEWLRNGEWKLLSSPTEGLYIVRLSDVSLTPMEQLGRRLHSFSATAYEVAPASNATLEQMKFFEEGIQSYGY